MTNGRQLRIAAVGDLHFDETRRGTLMNVFAAVNHEADVLALCGDITAHGRPEQMVGFIQELAVVEVPVVAVLGNHDYEAERPDELADLLSERGVHVLDGGGVVVQGVGFAGTKGFAGGFGRGLLGPFGERLIKDFVQAAIDESLKLENALRMLNTDTKIALLHYSPIEETIVGEPEMIYPFLGTSRLLAPIEDQGAAAVFHGHAHHGAPEGRTPTGIPVMNVAMPVLKAAGLTIRVHRVGAPERRRRDAGETAA
ncbi:MAG TPA: metallophosphoesterase [Longimicrobiales bacterium]|nr:metallophosphoesterase [Longimicrobiales bacterium]